MSLPPFPLPTRPKASEPAPPSPSTPRGPSAAGLSSPFVAGLLRLVHVLRRHDFLFFLDFRLGRLLLRRRRGLIGKVGLHEVDLCDEDLLPPAFVGADEVEEAAGQAEKEKETTAVVINADCDEFFFFPVSWLFLR